MRYCPNPNCEQPLNLENAANCQCCNSALLLKGYYQLLQVIGQGGRGRTFRAIAQDPPSTYAIKQFFPQNQNLAPLFYSLTELEQHPQIPTVLDYFVENHYGYLVQTWIEGTHLESLLTEKGTFTEAQIWNLLVQILPVLQFIHDRQIIHRDIKPVNLIRRPNHGVSKRGEFCLVDFGSVKQVISHDLNLLEVGIGSPEYVAPEQAQGNAVYVSDLYSLGVTCIHLLTGISPFDLFEDLNHTWVWQQFLTQPVSDGLVRVLNKLLQVDPHLRFQSAAAVMQAVLPNTGQFQSPIQLRPQHWVCTQTLKGHTGAVTAIAYHAADNCLISGGADRTIRLWDLRSGQQMAVLESPTGSGSVIALHPTRFTIASTGNDKTIQIWDGTQRRIMATLTGHTQPVKALAFSPDGNWLLSGSGDKTLKLWDCTTQQVMQTLVGHKLQITAVAFSPDGQYVASASLDRTVQVWQLNYHHGSLSATLRYTLSDHTRAVFAVAFSLDSKILVSGGDDNSIKLWDIETGQLVRSVLGHSWSVVTLAFHQTPMQEQPLLISGSWDHTVKLWQIQDGRELTTLSGHTDSVHAIAIAADGSWIASGSRDKTIKLWYWQPTGSGSQ